MVNHQVMVCHQFPNFFQKKKKKKKTVWRRQKTVWRRGERQTNINEYAAFFSAMNVKNGPFSAVISYTFQKQIFKLNKVI